MAQRNTTTTDPKSTPMTDVPGASPGATAPTVVEETQAHQQPHGAPIEPPPPSSRSPLVHDNLGRAYDAPDLPPGFGERVLHACLSPALGELRVFDEESIRARARNAAALVLGADAVTREYIEGRR